MNDEKLIITTDLCFEKSKAAEISDGSKHIHHTFEFYYLENGKCDYFINRNIYHLEPGDVLIIPRGVLHKTFYSSLQRGRTLIYFSAAFVPASIMPKISTAPVQIRNQNLQADIRFYLNKIEENYQSDLPNAKTLLSLSLESLFLILFQSEQTNESVKPKQLVCDEILKYIQTHYQERITLSDLAKRFSISETYLSKIIKKECGFGFCEYLLLTRLQNARNLLLNDSALSITEIAYACGFPDSNYFSVCFKKAFGMVPRELRNQVLD